MWLLLAVGSAFFAGITSILAKCGIQNTDSTVATAIRTIVVLTFSWLMVFVVGSQEQITDIDTGSLAYILLSGLATGASWLCYFKALQLGDVNKVVPVDKSSTVLTIILAFIIFHESVGVFGAVGVCLIAAGTYLMIEKKDVAPKDGAKGNWLLYALGSAVFAALVAILAKAGMAEVESTLGTALRTIVVLIMAWVMVFVQDKQTQIKDISRKELGFICLSGVATGASWLCYFAALATGPASVVVPIDKLSILVTIAFSAIVFGERLTKKSAWGLAAITVGTLLMTL